MIFNKAIINKLGGSFGDIHTTKKLYDNVDTHPLELLSIHLKCDNRKSTS